MFKSDDVFTKIKIVINVNILLKKFRSKVRLISSIPIKNQDTSKIFTIINND